MSELKICAAIIGLFAEIPAASTRFVEPLLKLVLETENVLMVETASPLRQPLVKFLLKYPQDTADLILSPNYIKVIIKK